MSLMKSPDESVGLCWLTRPAVLRRLTSRVAMNGAPVAPEVALNTWEALAVDPRPVFLDAAPARHESCFVSLVAGRQPTSNLWAGAWLASLARSLDRESGPEVDPQTILK